MRACGSALVRALGGLLMMVLPGVVYAQGAPRLPAFRPDVTFGIVFDDNVFMRTDPEGDIFIRLTPGFDVVHDSRPLSVSGSFRFDAERYQERPDLNEAVARQASSLDLTWRPNTRFGLISRAAYQRTQTPVDLNAATGLTGGRQPAWSTDLSVAFENTIRPRRRLTVGADYNQYVLELGPDTNVRAVRVRYNEDRSPRTQLHLSYGFEQRQFVPGPLLISHVAMGGYSYRLTNTLSLVLEGGARNTEGEWAPLFNIQAAHTIGTITTFSAGYAHTEEVAVGVVGLIKVDRLTTAVSLRRSPFWELILGAGAFRNVQVTVDTIAYDLSASVGRRLSDALWLVVSASRNYNDHRQRGGVIPDSEIERNVLMISVRVQPFRPR